MKTAIIGSNGQLGSDLTQAFKAGGGEVFPLTHADIEVSDMDSVTQVLRALQPNLIVNTAAMHNAEKCEADPERAYRVNAIGTRNLAITGNELDAVLVHLSTDYVFNGAKETPYEEQDLAQPLNAYGESKLAGEEFVQTTAKRYFVVRTSGLYGSSPCRGKGGQNFVQRMLRMAQETGKVRVVNDETITPTHTVELAAVIAALAQTDSYGLYHATAEGQCTWFDFARKIFQFTGTQVVLEAAGADEFPSKTRRPKYSVLENAALKKIHLNFFQPWESGLRNYLAVETP